jgi:hypothetical protein
MSLPPADARIRVIGVMIAGSTSRALRTGPSFVVSLQWKIAMKRVIPPSTCSS